MPKATVLQPLRRYVLLSLLLPVVLANPSPTRAQNPATAPQQSQQIKPPKPVAKTPSATPGEQATLEAKQQRQVGQIFYADGDVDVRYENTRLRADHVEYNEDTQVVVARGRVQLDYLTQHLEATDARYELSTGRGTFHNVRATFAVQRRPPAPPREVNAMQRQPAQTLLISPNPIYFEAEEAERVDENTYIVHHSWMTVCDPDKPTWKFYAPKATVYIKTSIHLENGSFRVFSVPILYVPYATFPAEKQRASGFLLPDSGESSSKGFIFGDAVYWAPTDWADFTLGANYYSRRGWAQKAALRVRPWENAVLDVTYSEVEDRGLPQPTGPPINQGGLEVRLLFTALLPNDWRAVADLDDLSSLTYRLAWSETYVQAVNSEVRNSAFLTKNFRGFSLNFAALSYQNYVNATPSQYVSLRTAPEVRFGSVDQAPWRNLPFYFSFEAFSDAAHRSNNVTNFTTPNFVERSEVAPSVTMPFHLGSWLSVTPTFTFRSTYYGGQIQNGSFVDVGFFRNTEELSVDIRPPTLDRIWVSADSGTKWKHVIEPEIVYNYVNGVTDFSRIVRFDQDETLSNTNEFEYGVTQRLYRRRKDGTAEEIVSWKLAQKYFFNPTFGGALVVGQRNVFQTTDALTPFAFASQPYQFSPIVSDLRVEPGKHFDTQFIVNFDPRHGQLNAIGTLLKLKPYKESFITLAHFSVLNLPTPPQDNPPDFIFEPRSNQIRALIGYGDLTRRGWNATFGASYDITEHEFQNQVAEVIYNSSCCGFGVGYRKFSFGSIRNENQYLWVFRISNLGSVGTLLRPEKIF